MSFSSGPFLVVIQGWGWVCVPPERFCVCFCQGYHWLRPLSTLISHLERQNTQQQFNLSFKSAWSRPVVINSQGGFLPPPLRSKLRQTSFLTISLCRLEIFFSSPPIQRGWPFGSPNLTWESQFPFLYLHFMKALGLPLWNHVDVTIQTPCYQHWFLPFSQDSQHPFRGLVLVFWSVCLALENSSFS